MHSRIIQISKQPISESDYLTCDDILYNEDGFIPYIADYVKDLDDDVAKADLKEWLETGKDLDIWNFAENNKQTYIIFSEEQLKNYRKRRLDIILNECQKVIINKNSIEDEFIESGGMSKFYSLKSALNDELQHRIFERDEWLSLNINEEKWLCTEAEPNVKYYVGNILDYHF